MKQEPPIAFTQFCAKWAPVKDNEELVAPDFGNEYWDYRGAPVGIERPKVSLLALTELVCNHLGVTVSQLSGRGKRGILTEARVILSSLAVRIYGHKSKDLAQLLSKNPFSVSRWLTQACDPSTSDRITKRVDEIDQIIRSTHEQITREERTKSE